MFFQAPTFNATASAQVVALAAAVEKNPEKFSDFEKNYIADNEARVRKFGEEGTYFSEKQVALFAKIHKERVVDGKAPGKK